MNKNRLKIPSVPQKTQPERAIPASAALSSKNVHNYRISFEHYDQNICELSLLQKSMLTKCVKTFKVISKCKPGEFEEQNLEIKRIANTNDYKKLYAALPSEGIQLLECKLSLTARIFYYISGTDFNIVTITSNHLETKKTKR